MSLSDQSYGYSHDRRHSDIASESQKKPVTLLVNMDSSVDRLATCKQQLASINLPFTRVPAVDGRALSQQALSQFLVDDFSAYYKALTAGEIGCYLSHRKCWQLILDNDVEYALILEDDFLLTEDLTTLGQYIANIEHSWDCIKLMENPIKRKVLASFPCDDKELVVYNKIPSKTCAYALSKEGARKMLNKSKVIERPVDIDFQYWWENDMEVFGLKPYMVSVDQRVESTIDNMLPRKNRRKSMLKKLVHKCQFIFNNKRHLIERLRRLKQNL